MEIFVCQFYFILKYKDDVKMVLNDQKHYKLIDKNPLKDLKYIAKILVMS